MTNDKRSGATLSHPITAPLDRLLLRHQAAIERAIGSFGLPLHVMFLEQWERNAAAFLQVARRLYPKTLIFFAVKSNPCRGAVRAAKRCGLGVDAASEHELQAALEEGIAPERITCNGNAKSFAYLRMATGAGAILSVDNDDELDQLEEIAASTTEKLPILLRFRGMPLSGLTSDDQATAADWTKFGFHISDAERLLERLRRSNALRFAGVSAHIGTQIANPAGYERLLTHLLALCERASAQGLPVERIDLGGGFPVRFLTETEWTSFTRRLRDRLSGDVPDSSSVTWNDLPLGYAHLLASRDASPQWIGKAYWTDHPGAEMLEYLLRFRFDDGRTTTDRLAALGSPTLVIEPGRSMAANAGVTLTQVTGTKTVLGHHVVSLDMGINNHGTNLITPDIFPAAVLPQAPDDVPIEAFLAGRLCFSGDMISKVKISLNRLPRRGERFALYATGAYSADHFASNSCGFPRPGKIALRTDGTVEVWRKPERFEDVFGDADESLVLDPPG